MTTVTRRTKIDIRIVEGIRGSRSPCRPCLKVPLIFHRFIHQPFFSFPVVSSLELLAKKVTILLQRIVTCVGTIKEVLPGLIHRSIPCEPRVYVYTKISTTNQRFR
nr:hypothetical protein [Solanum melongena]WMB96806.1 hypothetical protein [Solanum melongena]WMB97028.1 hypothetical protein [Solanum aethiopicum]